MRVFLSAGHQGPRTGAVSLLDEGAETIRLRDDVTRALLRRGVEVVNDEDGARLSAVIAAVNGSGADVAIELHFNGSPDGRANGTECIIADKHSRASERLARSLTAAVCRALGTRDRTNGRGFKTETASARGRLGFVRDTRCPAVIVETCFVGNEDDANRYCARYGALVEAVAMAVAGCWL